MEPVLFYGVPHGCSFGSIVALEWLGRPYRLCRIEMPLETGERTYVRLNPARQTPTLLLEDGRALSEAWPFSSTWQRATCAGSSVIRRAAPSSTN